MVELTTASLTQEIQNRFDVIDDWIIHYHPTNKPSTESAKIYLSFLEQKSKSILNSGKKPGLLINIMETNLPHQHELRNMIMKGIQSFNISAIAAYGLSGFLNRTNISMTLRQGIVVPCRFFQTKEQAKTWLKKSAQE